MQLHLHETAYSVIAHDMSTTRPGRISALISPYDKDEAYGDVYDVVDTDFSLTRQLMELYLNPSAPMPDAYLFTRKSAVPAADTFRGIFNTIQPTAMPVLGTIHANRRRSTSPQSSGGRYNPVGPNTYIGKKLRAHEIQRLAPTIGLHTVIVEQSISTGATAAYAAEIALEAGAEHVSIIRGHWYKDVRSGDVDIANVTSRHAPFMCGVGIQIAKQL